MLAHACFSFLLVCILIALFPPSRLRACFCIPQYYAFLTAYKLTLFFLYQGQFLQSFELMQCFQHTYCSSRLIVFFCNQSQFGLLSRLKCPISRLKIALFYDRLRIYVLYCQNQPLRARNAGYQSFIQRMRQF